MSDMEEEDGGLEGRDDDWLMKRLPSLPHFKSVLPKVSHLLLQACLVETNLKHLLSFILFITNHIPRDLIFEFSIGISQIIVDRFSIIKKVFKPQTQDSEGASLGAQSMLGSLLNMLRVSLETAIQSQRMPQVSGSSDFVVVGFPSGKKTILHTALIHATILLLTCPCPPAQRSDFKFLMELWFPTGDQFPEAYTVEEKEATPVISRAILPEMMCSQNSRVLGLCLRDAGIAELCASVRQFGIPAANMQRILAHLDGMCGSEQNVEALEKVVENPAHLAQFAEVQLMRCGSSDGKTFLSLVRKLGDLPDDPVLSVSEMLLAGDETQEVEMTPVSPSTEEKSAFLQLSAEKAEQVLMKSFAPSVGRSSLPIEEVHKLVSDIEKGLKKLIQSTASARTSSEERAALSVCANIVITALHKVVVQSTGRTRRQILEGMTKTTFGISLLRLVTRIQQLKSTDDDTTELLRATVKQISDSLATLKVGKLKQLPRFQAVVRASAKHLGLKTSPERESYSEKVAKAARDCASGIKREQNFFSTEQAMMIGDICRFVGMEKQSPLVEDVLSALVRRSIVSGMEGKCLDLLQKLEWRCSPIALHCPETFHSVHWRKESEKQEGRESGEGGTQISVGSNSHVSTSHSPFVHSLDMSGLKVDLIELLDPEVLRVTPEATRKEVFGWSVTGKEREERGMKSLAPGYLMARLVHQSSWTTLHSVLTSLLEKECLDER